MLKATEFPAPHQSFHLSPSSLSAPPLLSSPLPPFSFILPSHSLPHVLSQHNWVQPQVPALTSILGILQREYPQAPRLSSFVRSTKRLSWSQSHTHSSMPCSMISFCCLMTSNCSGSSWTVVWVPRDTVDSMDVTLLRLARSRPFPSPIS